MEFLSLCSNLSSLTLEGNPICVKPNPETQPVSGKHLKLILQKQTIKMKFSFFLECKISLQKRSY